ncbi:hypothetical protein COCOBI_03-7330 [Coccomyxa sp. Obi]|nr:hypothetical protein COCOBI_03-7330 [Coccomyxa sp. Obi]
MSNPRQEKALKEKDIKPGDYVATRIGGGTREGPVERIDTENPRGPKVVSTTRSMTGRSPTTLALCGSLPMLRSARTPEGQSTRKDRVQGRERQVHAEEQPSSLKM